MEKHLIRTVLVTNGILFAISNGQRTAFAKFKGSVEISEERNIIHILGNRETAAKKIGTPILMCDDIDYTMLIDDNYIHTGKIYEAVGDIQGRRIQFFGMQFYDSNPLSNSLTFEIKDMELIESLLREE